MTRDRTHERKRKEKEEKQNIQKLFLIKYKILFYSVSKTEMTGYCLWRWQSTHTINPESVCVVSPAGMVIGEAGVRTSMFRANPVDAQNRGPLANSLGEDTKLGAYLLPMESPTNVNRGVSFPNYTDHLH